MNVRLQRMDSDSEEFFQEVRENNDATRSFRDLQQTTLMTSSIWFNWVLKLLLHVAHVFSGSPSTHGIVTFRWRHMARRGDCFGDSSNVQTSEIKSEKNLRALLHLHPCCILSNYISPCARCHPSFPSENIQILIFGVDYHSNKHKFGSALTIAWDDPTDNCFHPTDNCLESVGWNRFSVCCADMCMQYILYIIHRAFISAACEIIHWVMWTAGSKVSIINYFTQQSWSAFTYMVSTVYNYLHI